MTGWQRREQLISIGRALFAERGFDGTSVEEIASQAGVTKPVVYEHFGGKEGLYAVIVDREMLAMEKLITESFTPGPYKVLIEKLALALFTYVEQQPDGFRILARDSTPGSEGGYSTLLNSMVGKVAYLLADTFEEQGLDPSFAILYGQALVGMVSVTAQWWLDDRSVSAEELAAHIANLCWNGLKGLKPHPELSGESMELRDQVLRTYGEEEKKEEG